MYIAYNNSDKKIIAIRETEWQCRMTAKGIDLIAYNAWVKTVTSEDENGHKTYDFSGEDYEIVKTNGPFSYETKDSEDKDITVTFNESGHIHSEIDIGQHYHLKWDGSKIVKDDDALSACQTAEKWKNVRRDRNIRLAETDYLALSDQTLSNDMKTYRQALRDVPSQSDPDNITWPTKP